MRKYKKSRLNNLRKKLKPKVFSKVENNSSSNGRSSVSLPVSISVPPKILLVDSIGDSDLLQPEIDFFSSNDHQRSSLNQMSQPLPPHPNVVIVGTPMAGKTDVLRSMTPGEKSEMNSTLQLLLSSSRQRKSQYLKNSLDGEFWKGKKKKKEKKRRGRSSRGLDGSRWQLNNPRRRSKVQIPQPNFLEDQIEEKFNKLNIDKKAMVNYLVTGQNKVLKEDFIPEEEKDAMTIDFKNKIVDAIGTVPIKNFLNEFAALDVYEDQSDEECEEEDSIPIGMKKVKVKLKNPPIPFEKFRGKDKVKVVPNVVIQKSHFFEQARSKWGCVECRDGLVSYRGTVYVNGIYQELGFQCSNPECADIFGLASCMKIKIPLSIYKRAGLDKRPYPFPLFNVQYVVGEIFTGGLDAEFRDFLQCMGTGAPSEDAVRDLKMLVGEAFIEVCEQSEKKWLDKEDEVEFTLMGKDGSIRLKFDGSWTKRGSGRGHNSPFGWVLGIGGKFNKILKSEMYNKCCGICEYAEKKKLTPRKHKCFRNHLDSSKAMEPKGAAEIFDYVNKTTRCGSDRFVADGDSSTLARIRQKGYYNAKKDEDKNHFKNYMMEWLMELKKEKYANANNVLTKTHRDQLITYVLKILNDSNKDKKKAIHGLEGLIPKLCTNDEGDGKEHWLRFSGDTLQLQKDLDERFISKLVRKIDTLLDLGCTNQCEAGNGVMHLRGKKISDDSRTGSAVYKSKGGVALFNEGPVYVFDVQKKLGVPMTEYDVHHFQGKQKKRDYLSSYKKSKEFKERRYKKKSKGKVVKKSSRPAYLHGMAFEEKEKKFTKFVVEDPENYHYGLPLKTSESVLKKRKRYVDEDAEKNFPTKNYGFELICPPRKRLKKTVKLSTIDTEHGGGKKKDASSYQLLQAGVFDMETGKLTDVVFKLDEVTQMTSVVKSKFVPKVQRSTSTPVSKAVGLEKLLRELIFDDDGNEFDESFAFAAAGKHVDWYAIQKDINRLEDVQIRKRLQRYFDKVTKLDQFALIGNNSVDSQIEILRLQRVPDDEFIMKQLNEKFEYSIGEGETELPIEKLQHNGCFDAYLEGMSTLQVFSPKQLHEISSFAKEKCGNMVGGTQTVRKKIKTQGYANYFGKLREEGVVL